MTRMPFNGDINEESKVHPLLPQLVRDNPPVAKPILIPVALQQRPSPHLLENLHHLVQSAPVPRRDIHARFEEFLRGDQIFGIFRADGLLEETPHAHVHLVLDGRLGGAVRGIVQTCVRNEVTAGELVEIGAGVDAGINAVQNFHRGTHAAGRRADARLP